MDNMIRKCFFIDLFNVFRFCNNMYLSCLKDNVVYMFFQVY